LKYSVITFGCRVNQADSLGFEEELLSQGAIAVAPEHADLVVVNTCSVTATADQGARQTIRRVARENPSARIVVTGCYATRRPEDVRDLPNVIRVVPNDDKPKMLSVLEELTTATRFGAGDGGCGAAVVPGVAGRTAFTLRVQTGCGEACSYCIIPSTRGRPRSVTLDVLLADIGRVVAAGFKEIALTGVHLGSYGRDLTPSSSLFELLEAVRLKANAVALFRISSLEPMDCSPAIVDLVSAGGCFAPHFHLPLQHASNAVLAAMRRPYTIEYYSALVDDIRARMPHAAIGSDVIVGFPGETDADFDDTLTLTRAVRYHSMFSFKYSPRPNTLADKRMPDDVPETEKTRRIVALQALQREIQTAINEQLIGSVEHVLIDAASRRRDAEVSGRTSTNVVVNLPGQSDWIGRTMPVLIERAGPHSVWGRPAGLDRVAIGA
jgi:MiaB/RimO family radical SAM methylthiotransferase